MNRIAVLGGYSDLAWNLCRRLVDPTVELVLIGRDAEHLQRVASDMRSRGAARVEAIQSGLADYDPGLVDRVWSLLGQLDMLILAYATMDAAEPGRLHQINAISAEQWLRAFGDRMAKVNGGHLVVFGSVAGDRVRPATREYGVSKAALAKSVARLRRELAGHNVDVTLVKPGPTRTRMTRELQAGSLWAEPAQVAAQIQRRLPSRPKEIYAPPWWRWIMLILRAIPGPIFRRLRI